MAPDYQDHRICLKHNWIALPIDLHKLDTFGSWTENLIVVAPIPLKHIRRHIGPSPWVKITYAASEALDIYIS